jgi:hypothetical protein
MANGDPKKIHELGTLPEFEFITAKDGSYTAYKAPLPKSKGRPSKTLGTIKRSHSGPDPRYDETIGNIAKDLKDTKRDVAKLSKSPKPHLKTADQIQQDWKKYTIPGQSISESGHVEAEDQPYKSKHAAGPSEGDLIKGVKRNKEGFIKDFDYHVQYKKDTADASGPFKIFEVQKIK